VTRELVLDTETTGLDPNTGDRIVEIGAVELINHMPTGRTDQAVDTLDIARRKFPGAQNSLDALCRRFGIDNSMREKHGALLDSEILAEVYLELMGGRQPDLVLATSQTTKVEVATTQVSGKAKARENPLASLLSEDEKAAHSAFVETLGDAPLWKN